MLGGVLRHFVDGKNHFEGEDVATYKGGVRQRAPPEQAVEARGSNGGGGNGAGGGNGNGGTSARALV